MLNIPAYTYLERGSFADLSTDQTVTPPMGASGMLVQAFTQNVQYELYGTGIDANSLEIVAGQNPLFIPVDTSMLIRFHESAASATLRYQFVRARAL